MATQQEIYFLLDKVSAGTAARQDCQQILDILKFDKDSGQALAIIQNYYEEQNLVFTDAGNPVWEEIFQSIVGVDKIKSEMPSLETESRKQEFTVYKGKKTKRFYWVAACVIGLIAIAGLLFYNLTFFNSEPEISSLKPDDISAPATNRATITLANGSMVYLDSVDNGQLVNLGNIKLVKLANGKIAYQTVDGKLVRELQYNILTNPKGSRVIDMTLSDGTRVWLNAGSSIAYPVAFIGDERKVELKGEGYFEVAKDAVKKFIVTANGTTTEVLGTHFNVNAYEDEPEMKVTLLEGAVAVSSLRYVAKVILKPGQQATVNETQSNIQLSRPNLDHIMAWKAGFFVFTDLGFEEVMKKIERWYDVRVVYLNDIPKIKLDGDLSRNTSLNEALDALRFQGANLKLESRTVVVY